MVRYPFCVPSPPPSFPPFLRFSLLPGRGFSFLQEKSVREAFLFPCAGRRHVSLSFSFRRRFSFFRRLGKIGGLSFPRSNPAKVELFFLTTQQKNRSFFFPSFSPPGKVQLSSFFDLWSRRKSKLSSFPCKRDIGSALLFSDLSVPRLGQFSPSFPAPQPAAQTPLFLD